MKCRSLPIPHVFKVIMDLPDDSKEPHPTIAQKGHTSGEPSGVVHRDSVYTVSRQKGSKHSTPSWGETCAVIAGSPGFSWPVL